MEINNSTRRFQSQDILMKRFARFVLPLLAMTLTGCSVIRHESAKEHDFACSIMDRVDDNPKVASIQRRHRKHFNEDDKEPSLWVVYDAPTQKVVGLLYREVDMGNGKYKFGTPNITNQEIETIWNVFTSEVSQTGFKGKISMVVYPDGKRTVLRRDLR
jgi:hypothetical protein